MRPFLPHQCLLFALFLNFSVSGKSFAQSGASFFSGVTNPTETLTPLPTDAEVQAAEAAAIEAAKPKPIVKVAIPQRAEQLAEDVFIILPREAPLPTGTISGGFFIEESGQAPTAPPLRQKPVAAVPATPAAPAAPPVPRAPTAAPELVEVPLFTDNNETSGYEVVRIEPDQAVETIPKPIKKPEPKVAYGTTTLNYDMDMVLAKNEAGLFALKEKVAGQDIKSIQVIANGEAPPLTDYAALVQRRLKPIKAILGFGNKVPVQKILLRDGTEQSLRLRVVYQAPASAR